jgi:hypothetical protein
MNVEAKYGLNPPPQMNIQSIVYLILHLILLYLTEIIYYAPSHKNQEAR